jgi:L-asparaginase II
MLSEATARVTGYGPAFSTAVCGLIIDSSNEVIAQIGNTDQVVFTRSVAKIPHTIALFQSSVFSNPPNWEIALACSSHSAEPEHMKKLLDFSNAYSLDIDNLQCSVRRPLRSEYTEREMDEKIVTTSWPKLFNECSGEHLGAMALAKCLNQKETAYLEYDGEAMRAFRIAERDFFGAGLENCANDNRDECGMIASRCSVKTIADAFARFSSFNNDKSVQGKICTAITSEPLLFSGRHQYVYGLTTQSKGRILGKAGADGLYAFWWPRQGLAGAVYSNNHSHAVASSLIPILAKQGGLYFPDPSPPYYSDELVELSLSIQFE